VRLGAAAASALTAVGAVGGLLGALLAPALARLLGTARAMIVAGLGAGLAGLLIPLTDRGPRLVCYLAGAALVSAGIAAANVIAGSFRQQYCPPAALGRVTAVMRFAALGLIPFGSLLAGWTGTELGARGGLWVLQAVMAAAGLLLLTKTLRASRDLPTSADFRAGTY
jgi:MFS family permease